MINQATECLTNSAQCNWDIISLCIHCAVCLTNVYVQVYYIPAASCEQSVDLVLSMHEWPLYVLGCNGYVLKVVWHMFSQATDTAFTNISTRLSLGNINNLQMQPPSSRGEQVLTQRTPDYKQQTFRSKKQLCIASSKLNLHAHTDTYCKTKAHFCWLLFMLVNIVITVRSEARGRAMWSLVCHALLHHSLQSSSVAAVTTELPPDQRYKSRIVCKM